MTTLFFLAVQTLYEDVIEPRFLQPLLRRMVDEWGCTCLSSYIFQPFRDTLVNECTEVQPREFSIAMVAKASFSFTLDEIPPPSSPVLSPVLEHADRSEMNEDSEEIKGQQRDSLRDSKPSTEEASAVASSEQEGTTSTASTSDVEANEEKTSTVVKRVEVKKKYAISFFYLQLIISVITFIIICATYEPGRGAWQGYENFIGLISNSCIVTTLASAFIKIQHLHTLHYGVAEGDNYFDLEKYDPESIENAKLNVKRGIAVISFMVSVSLVTHVVPGLIFYWWIFFALSIAGTVCFNGCFLIVLAILSITIGGCIMSLFSLFLSKEAVGRFKTASSDLLGKFFRHTYYEFPVRIMVIVVFQTPLNYMTLLYHYGLASPENYVNVIYQEYRLRSQTPCFLEHIFDDAKHMIPFLAWM